MTYYTAVTLILLLPYTKSAYYNSTSPSVSGDLLTSGRNFRGATVTGPASISEIDLDYNIADLQDAGKLQCYLGYINRTEDSIYCNSTNGVPNVLHVGHPCIGTIDHMIACNICCIRMLDICPYISHKTRSKIDSLKFWLDGVLKAFLSNILSSAF